MAAASGLKINGFSGRKVIFNKNLYHGFRALGLKGPDTYPYLNPEVMAVFAVSDHNARHLRFAYPGIDVFRVYTSIRSDIFRYRSWAQKRPRIVTIAKAAPQLLTIYHTLMSRAVAGLNNASAFEWIFVEDRSEQEMAKLLGSAVAVVFASVEEGLPRFLLESLASGCVVIAFKTGALKECLPEYCRFDFCDSIEAVSALERVLADFPSSAALYEPQIMQGVEIVRAFTRERQVRSVIDAWDAIHSERRFSPSNAAVL
jgi:hypothetical protein